MIERLVRGYDRAEQLLTDLKILGVTVVEIAVAVAGAVVWRFWRAPQVLTFDDLFEKRCQHCEQSISFEPPPPSPPVRLGRWRGADGSTSCDGTLRMLHEPMPKIR